MNKNIIVVRRGVAFGNPALKAEALLREQQTDATQQGCTAHKCTCGCKKKKLLKQLGVAIVGGILARFAYNKLS